MRILVNPPDRPPRPFDRLAAPASAVSPSSSIIPVPNRCEQPWAEWPARFPAGNQSLTAEKGVCKIAHTE
ncbi:hypothetical protein GCM10022223_61730 [Kineosporia mesophila]|uniref:Uncharacterized protein n=1 Tax=Kineosporia mesophila TaxID=566012 RepID=A0ABP7AL57_9ACTN